MRAGGPHHLLPSRTSARSPIYLYWLRVSPPPPPPRFRPTETPIPRRPTDAQVDPRLPFGKRASPTHHTGRRAALAPSRRLLPEPALLMPLGAPSCPVAAHRPPDATNLSIGQGTGELSIQGARPGQQALVRVLLQGLGSRARIRWVDLVTRPIRTPCGSAASARPRRGHLSAR